MAVADADIRIAGGNPQRNRHRDVHLVINEWRGDNACADLLSHHPPAFGAGFRQEHQKFIPAPARYLVLLADNEVDDGCQVDQDEIAGIVTILIIDILEIINVDHDQGERLAGLFQLFLFLVDAAKHDAPVGQVGHRVSGRQVGQAFVGQQ